MMGESSTTRPVKPSDNPFRSGCVDGLAYVSPTGETWETIVSRVKAANFRGALVGPHGHGKSTLMHQLALIDPPSGLTQHPVIQVMADGSNVDEVKRALTAGDGRLFIDGIDLLPWRLRRGVAHRREVIVTSHRTTRLPTLVDCETTPGSPGAGVLGELVGRLSPSVRAALGDEGVTALHERHRGNVRDALRELYDRVAVGEFKI